VYANSIAVIYTYPQTVGKPPTTTATTATPKRKQMDGAHQADVHGLLEIGVC